MAWQIGRRPLLAAALGLGASALVGAGPIPRGELVYIGMHGPNIHAARFDVASGALTALGPVADNPRPTWAVRHPRLPVLYFARERDPANPASVGAVQIYRIERGSGTLTKLGEIAAPIAGTTHLTIDRPSQTLIAANYNGSVMALPIRRDGMLGGPVSVVPVQGKGPHPRQTSAHAHGVALSPDGRFVLVADLGADRIWVLPFDRQTRQIGPYDPADPRHYVAAPGSGPRHTAWHPDRRTLYLVNELTASVEVLRWDAQAAQLTSVQAISTDDPAFTGTKSAAEIAVSRDGRFVYVSNRGDHMLVVFAVDSKSKQLRLIQRISSGGPWPWHFSIHAGGRWLIAANRDADALALFRIDPRTGLLTDSGKRLASPKPVHVNFTGL